jgi:FG-GAP repeat
MSAYEGHSGIDTRPGRLRRPPRESTSRRPNGGRAPARGVLAARRRELVLLAICLALLALALALAFALGAAGLLDAGAPSARAVQRRAPLTSHGLLSLPSSLQGPASVAIAARVPAYRAAPAAGGFRFENPGQRLAASFGAGGLSVASGKLHLGVRLAEAGFGGALQQIGAATPTANANRVSYQRPWLTEWYANGPLGLEQGFTVPHRPAAASGSTLTLSLAVSGGARAVMVGHGHVVRFSAGGSSLRYDSLVAQDASGHTLPSTMGLHDGRLVLGVDTYGAAYPLHIDPFIQQGSKLTAGETGAGVFGSSVAISGDGKTALVGAPNDSPRNVTRAGAVWVFTLSGETWTQQGEPLTGVSASDAYFGTGVALSANGNTALIGSTGGGSKEEPAYVFTRSGTKWSPQAELKGAAEKSTSNFGSSVALSGEGKYALVGASGESSGAGAAYVFAEASGKWSEQTKLAGTGPAGAAHQGESVAVNEEGTTALIGGPGDLEAKGAVWAFTRSGATWKQLGEKLANPEGESGTAHFGDAVALGHGGLTAVIGAPGDNGDTGAAWIYVREGEKFKELSAKLTGGTESGKAEFGSRVAIDKEGITALIGGPQDNSGAGAAWLFTRQGEAWKQLGPKHTAGAEEIGKGAYGSAVALSQSGGSMIIGAATDNSEQAGWGAAWAYSRSGETWTQLGEKLTGTIEQGLGRFGIDTAISGDGKTALVGAYEDNEGKGAVWVFTRSGSEWSHQGNRLTGGGEEIGAGEFGNSLALSQDGNTALIAGQNDNSQAGAVWVFTRVGGIWFQQGKKLVATSPKHPGGSLFGSSVALSGNGNTALIGVRGEEAAYVFSRSEGAWTPQQTLTDPEGKGSFGEMVALSADGTTAAVGDPEDNSETGSAWIFVRRNGEWAPQGSKLTGAGQKGEVFGGPIALSEDGSTALIAANNYPFTGAAYVFTRTGESWTQQGGRLVGSGVVAHASRFATSVALSGDGNTALIGGAVESNRGAIWEFTRSESTWKQLGEKVTATGEEGEAAFGSHLAMSSDGTTALVAGPVDDEETGAVWAFMESPSLRSPAATEVTKTTAKLNATVNPQGEEVTECTFEYGTSTSYGKTAACSPPKPGSGTTAVPVSATVDLLSANTVYHFRLSSSNGHGVQQTEDQTFTTLEESAMAETKSPAEPAKAETPGGGLSVTGSGGTGQVTIGPYGSNIGGGGLPESKGTYFQVFRSEGSSFTRIKYKDCELGGAHALWWDNPETGWEPIPSSMAVFTEDPTPCITVTATVATTPSIAQLSDPRHVGGPAVNGELGKCELAKHGGYTEAAGKQCGASDTSKGKGKGKYEWYAAPAPKCFPLKHGFFKEENSSLECADEAVNTKKQTGEGAFETTGGNNFTSSQRGLITLKKSPQESQPLLECEEITAAGKETSSRQSEEQLTYKGCKHQGAKCETAGNAIEEKETIHSEVLESYISKSFVVEEKEEVAGEYLEVLGGKELGARTAPAGEPRVGPFMKFSCGGPVYEVTGAVEGALQGFSADVMTSKVTAAFASGSGAQDLYVKEGSSSERLPVVLTAEPTSEYRGEIEFGTVPAHSQKESVQLFQKKSGAKRYEEKQVSVNVGESVEYQVIVHNISPLTRHFSPLQFKECEGISPSGGFTLEPGKSQEFKCTRRFTAGEWEVSAWVAADEGFGTRESNTELVLAS